MVQENVVRLEDLVMPFFVCPGEKVQQEKLNMLFCGFGVGLSWGTVLLELDQIVCPEIIEI